MRCVNSRIHHLYVRWRRYQCRECGFHVSTLELTVDDVVEIRDSLRHVIDRLQPLPRNRRGTSRKTGTADLPDSGEGNG